MRAGERGGRLVVLCGLLIAPACHGVGRGECPAAAAGPVAPSASASASGGCLASGPGTPGVFDPTSFGARGDGRNDDGPAIQCALDAAAAYVRPGADPAKKGGVVSIPAGTFRITAPLEIRGSNLAIRGVSRGLTALRADRAMSVIRSAQPTRLLVQLRLEELQILFTDGHGGVGIDLTGFSASFVNRVTVTFTPWERASGTGLLLRGGHGSALGQASYYNRIDEFDYTSGPGSEAEPSVGIDFRSSEDVDAHGPNNNRVIGGHLAGGDFGVRVERGIGNVFIGLGLESIRLVHYEFGSARPCARPAADRTQKPSGPCVVDNQVFGGYDEGWDTSVLARFHRDTIRNQIQAGHVTSLCGAHLPPLCFGAGMFVAFDRGIDNRVQVGSNSYAPSTAPDRPR